MSVPPVTGTGGAPAGLPEANVASRLMRGGAARGAAFVAANGLAAVTAAFLTSQLGVVGFGEYSAIVAMTSIALIVADSGTTNLAARELAIHNNQPRVASIVGLRFGLAAGAALVMTLVAVLAGWRAELVLGTALSGVGVLMGVALSSYLVPAYARLELGRVALNEFLLAAGASVLVLAAIAADASLPVILSAQLLIGAPLALWAYTRAKGAMPRLPNFHIGSIRKLALEAASFAFAVSIGTLLCNVSQLTVSWVGDEHTQGITGLSWRIIIAAIAAAAVLVNGAIPAITAAGADDRRLAPAVEKIVGLAAAAGSFLGVGAFVAAPTIVALLGHGDFDAAIPVLHVYALVVPLSFIAAAGCITLLALGIHRPLAIVNAVALVMTIAGTAAGIALVGAAGIAIGNGLGVLALLVGQVLLWNGMRRSAAPGLASTVKCVLIGVLAAAVGALLPVPNLLQIALALALFIAGLLASGALPPEATVLLDRFRRRRPA